MARIKGQLLDKKPYNILKNGGSLLLTINPLSGLNPGDKIYQEILPNGIILLIPENLYENESLEV
jgi:hypothetical protein